MGTLENGLKREWRRLTTENAAQATEIERLRAALRWIEQQEPATHELTLAHQMAQHARGTLEGR